MTETYDYSSLKIVKNNISYIPSSVYVNGVQCFRIKKTNGNYDVIHKYKNYYVSIPFVISFNVTNEDVEEEGNCPVDYFYKANVSINVSYSYSSDVSNVTILSATPYLNSNFYRVYSHLSWRYVVNLPTTYNMNNYNENTTTEVFGGSVGTKQWYFGYQIYFRYTLTDGSSYTGLITQNPQYYNSITNTLYQTFTQTVVKQEY